MYRCIRTASILCLICGATFAAVRPMQAANLNLAAGAPEIAESGSWQSNPGTANDTSSFGGQNITNGGNSTPASFGLSNPGYVPVAETNSGEGSFWLPEQGSTPTVDGVASQGYVTIDLGKSYGIGEIDLFNSHNGTYYDRGTEQFQIDASNKVDASGNLINPTTILTGTLVPATKSPSFTGVYGPLNSQNQPSYITPQIFNPEGSHTTLGDYRYLTFIAINGLSNQPGLNEIRVFFTPEPGSLLLMGLGLVGLAVLRRRMK